MTANREKQLLAEISDRVHELYQSNDGPRLLNELMKSYPTPRRLKNAAGDPTNLPATTFVGG